MNKSNIIIFILAIVGFILVFGSVMLVILGAFLELNLLIYIAFGILPLGMLAFIYIGIYILTKKAK